MNTNLPSQRERAEATLDYIEKHYALGGGDYRNVRGKDGACFAWGLGVLLSAFVAAAENIDRAKYRPRLDALFNALERGYWRKDGPVPGYDAGRGNTGAPDRYYDDNAWIVIAYVDAYNLTRDRRYAEAADRALKFVLSGEDEKLGGGLYWHEKNREAKNTCSNAPGAVAALLAAKARLPGKRENEAAARRLRDWTRAKLQDPADGLYWDNVKVADGRIDKMKWSYNSALPIRLELLLGDKREAMRVADSSAKHWFDPAQHILKDDASFAHLLAEALLIADTRRFRPVVAESLDTLWTRVRRPDGSYPKKWEVGATGSEPEELLWIASNARAYAFAAGVLEKRR